MNCWIDFIHSIFPSGKAPASCDKTEATGRGMYEPEGVHGRANNQMECKSLGLFISGYFPSWYVSVTTEGLPSDHRIRAHCSWEHGRVCRWVVPSAVATLSGEVLEVETFDTLALLGSHPHCLRTPAHLTGGGTQISVHHRVRKWVVLPSDKEAEYLRNDFPQGQTEESRLFDSEVKQTVTTAYS